MNNKRRRTKHSLLNIPLPPWPIITLAPDTDLDAEKAAALRKRLRAACATRDLLADWVVELQDELTAQRALADELAAELERVYTLNDQGAVAIATLSEEDGDAEETRG
jgi:hypothetical protein